MKHTILFALLFISSVSFAQKKEKVYKLTEGQANLIIQVFQMTSKMLPSTEVISSNGATLTYKAMDSIGRVLYKQSVDTTK